MEKDNIIFREYRKEDREYIEDMIRKTWNYDKFCSPKVAKKMAKTYFINCFANQTYTKVATIENKVVGIIMGKQVKKFKCPIWLRIKQIISNISIYLSKEGRSAIKIFGNVTKIDDILLKETNKNYDGEVALFVMDSDYRGKGIGGKLFKYLLDYMKEIKANEIFLFTDTSCNYKFYEHKGMNRRGEKKHTYNIAGQQADMTFFLYDLKI